MIKLILPLIFLIFIGCNKKDSTPLSSAKSISSVIFKKSDNVNLSVDITGTVSSDSIFFDFPPNIAINSLIPTIEFSGNKIEPANRTAQDFTNSIKYKITAEDGSTNSYFFRITRTSSDTSALILGTWKILKDSVTNNNWVNPAGGYLLPGVYIGTSVDYWKFESNGIFSGRENNITGSDTYKLLADKKLEIPVWSIQYGPSTIETINNSELTVFFSATSSNGGQYFRKVYLNR